MKNTKYLLINLLIRDGEREHYHHCLHFTEAENIQFAAQRYVSTFWGWGERENNYWWFDREIIGQLKSVVEITKFEYDFMMQVQMGYRPKYNLGPDTNTRIQNAGHYLCDSDLSVEEQLDLIDKYMENDGDPDDLLENVHEDVIVWEPLEFRLTVEEFYSCIES